MYTDMHFFHLHFQTNGTRCFRQQVPTQKQQQTLNSSDTDINRGSFRCCNLALRNSTVLPIWPRIWGRMSDITIVCVVMKIVQLPQ